MAGLFEARLRRTFFLNEPAIRMLPLLSYGILVTGWMGGLFEARLRRAFFLMSLLLGCYHFRLMFEARLRQALFLMCLLFG